MSLIDRQTIAIRRPTAPERATVGAASYVFERPLAGLRVGLRHEGSWRSWMWIVDEWEDLLRRAGAQPVVVRAGGRVGDEGRQTTADVTAWAGAIDGGVSGLGTCGSCTSNSVRDAVTLERLQKPAVVAVCEEFETHARNMADYLGHPDLKMLVLPYPLEGRPEEEIRRIGVEYYPRALEILGVQ